MNELKGFYCQTKWQIYKQVNTQDASDNGLRHWTDVTIRQESAHSCSTIYLQKISKYKMREG